MAPLGNYAQSLAQLAEIENAQQAHRHQLDANGRMLRKKMNGLRQEMAGLQRQHEECRQAYCTSLDLTARCKQQTVTLTRQFLDSIGGPSGPALPGPETRIQPGHTEPRAKTNEANAKDDGVDKGAGAAAYPIKVKDIGHDFIVIEDDEEVQEQQEQQEEEVDAKPHPDTLNRDDENAEVKPCLITNDSDTETTSPNPTPTPTPSNTETQPTTPTWAPLTALPTRPEIQHLTRHLSAKTPLPQISATFPTVFLLANTWIELRCLHCVNNSATRPGRYFHANLQDTVQHVNSAHGTQCALDGVLAHCEGRVVSEEDVALLREGRQAVDEPIVSLKVRPGGRDRSGRLRKRAREE